MALIQLPYSENHLGLLDQLRTLPYFIVFDSPNQQHVNDSPIIATALPDRWLSMQTPEHGEVFKLDKALKYAVQGSFHTKDLSKIITDTGKKSLSSHFQAGWAGYLSYEFGYQQNHLSIEDINYPLLRIGLYLWSLRIDMEQRQTSLYFHPTCPDTIRETVLQRINDHCPAEAHFTLSTVFQRETASDRYLKDIARIHSYLTEGDCYQVNYTHSLSAQYQGDPWVPYRQLRAHSPAPFSGFFDTGSLVISSHSPEQFISVNGSTIITKPIKGTRPRGQTPEEDKALAQELLHSEKDQAENLMIVDLLRNDLSKTSIPGSMEVSTLFGLESYANVHHLVSTITAELSPQQSAMSCFLASYPGGSITGAPKKRAMEIIAELEYQQRGPYCGSLFYLDLDGHFNSSIMIRTLAYMNDTVRAWGGGGIVIDSDPEMEQQESLTKINNLIQLLENEFLSQSRQ
ncbi:aminodeoxychorismate synthase component I [Gynuella sunshinyii]|uniref:Anthranilate/para-aminobenzoate synthase component I n=1 Tax=Gynuella sunshinyii YC6258 TaxID=1445510 RepID=A0A0C5VM93_9GAMM|nr:aminodeoxychorismate synthase component I [Gynuella sunshinyii]AJQ95827.1 anthranilate/para-aminobenzoate synthase component I [Gynuella sunshinyii YC6258]